MPVTIGDITTTRVPGTFALVYLVANTIMNVTTQDEQVSVFVNAAAHLHPGGCFVVELIVPQLQAVPRGETGRVFTLDADHVGIETFDDPVGQIAWSHHWMEVQGRLVRHSAPYRFVWPSELDLMARLAGLRLRSRWADWERSPFTSDSASQVAVFEKAARERSRRQSVAHDIPPIAVDRSRSRQPARRTQGKPERFRRAGVQGHVSVVGPKSLRNESDVAVDIPCVPAGGGPEVCSPSVQGSD